MQFTHFVLHYQDNACNLQYSVIYLHVKYQVSNLGYRDRSLKSDHAEEKARLLY